MRARCHSPALLPVGAAGSSLPVLGSVCSCEPGCLLRVLFYPLASQPISDGLERPDADKNNRRESGAPSVLPAGGACAASPAGRGVPGQRHLQPLRCPWDGGRSVLTVLPQGTHESADPAPECGCHIS